MKTKNFKFKSMALVLFALVLSSNVWGEDVTYKFTPDATTTGNSATAYVTSAYSFTYNEIGWSFNQWNPKTLQIKTNQSSAGSEFNFKNTSAFPGKIKSVVITFSALTVSNASGLCFVGGSSAISSLSGGSAGSWNSTAKTLTWTPAETTNYTYFAFYQNGKVASGTNNLASSDAIVITYESAPSCTTNPTVSAGAISNATTSSLTFNCAGITSLGSTGCEITEYGYVYGTSSNPTTSSTKYKVGESYTTTGTAFAAHTATGLNCGTTYYMRPYAINGNGTAYGAQATLATSACLVDHFIDNIQETTGYTGDGKAVSASFTKASITLSDKTAATSGSCEELHYHFVGWVTAADRSAGNVDAEHIVNFQDSGNTPTGTTYYAVWAAEEQ